MMYQIQIAFETKPITQNSIFAKPPVGGKNLNKPSKKAAMPNQTESIFLGFKMNDVQM